MPAGTVHRAAVPVRQFDNFFARVPERVKAEPKDHIKQA
jgi:hypothetical protein